MKLTNAMYKVQIGMNCKDIDTDRMRDVRIIATTATDAIERNEYVAQVVLIERAD